MKLSELILNLQEFRDCIDSDIRVFIRGGCDGECVSLDTISIRNGHTMSYTVFKDEFVEANSELDDSICKRAVIVKLS